MSTRFLTGQRLTADLLNANIADWMPVTYTKSASTARNTTTTLADDPELQGIALAVGTYEIELLLFYTQTTTNTQDLKTRWAFSGTWNNSDRVISGISTASTASANATTEVNMAGTQASGQDAIYGGPATVIYNSAREISRNVVLTVAGNLSLQWAQNASSGNNTTVHGGTCFNIRKIA